MVAFGRKKKILDFILVHKRFCFNFFATNSANVIDGHLWTLLMENSVFLTFKSLHEMYEGCLKDVRTLSLEYSEIIDLRKF